MKPVLWAVPGVELEVGVDELLPPLPEPWRARLSGLTDLSITILIDAGLTARPVCNIMESETERPMNGVINNELKNKREYLGGEESLLDVTGRGSLLG